MPPEVRRIQRHDRADKCIAVGQSAWITRGHRTLHQWIHQALVNLDSLVGVDTQRTGRVIGAVRGVVVERLLECLGLIDIGLDRVGVGINGAVEDHRPHFVRVRLGIGRADPGPVGVAKIVQLVIADCGAKRVEVLGHTLGADIGQELGAHLVDAALNEGLGLILDPLDTFGAVVHLRIGPQPIVVRVGVAPDGWSGRADPAGIEAHQVETPAHLGRQALDQTGGGFDPGLPGSAGVDDQRPDLLAGGREPDQRQGGGVAVGLAVVDRNSHLAALRPRRNGQRLATATACQPARAPLHGLAHLRGGQHRSAGHHGAAAARREQRDKSGKHQCGTHGTGLLVQPHGQHAATFTRNHW